MNKKLCICVSGGLDSFTAIQYAKLEFCKQRGWNFDEDVILLCVGDITSSLFQKEKRILISLAKAYKYEHLLNFIYISDTYENLVREENSHVVLGRNAMLASIAAGMAETVWICGTAYEDNKGMYDKNTEFFVKMTDALTQACKYLGREKTFIESPFQGKIYYNRDFIYPLMEKQDMIIWLERLKLEGWRRTTSCFHHTFVRCGECVVCGKRFIYEKWVELQYGVEFDETKELRKTFISDPLDNKYLLETFEKMKDKNNEGRYHSNRVLVYETVLDYYANTKEESINV